MSPRRRRRPGPEAIKDRHCLACGAAIYRTHKCPGPPPVLTGAERAAAIERVRAAARPPTPQPIQLDLLEETQP